MLVFTVLSFVLISASSALAVEQRTLLLTQRFTTASAPASSSYASAMWAAPGDTEGFQFVVKSAASKLHIQMADGSDPFLSDNVRFLRVGFVHITIPSTRMGSSPGWYADPLPPVIGSGHTVTPNTWAGFAVMFDVPDSAPPGNYTGVVKITDADGAVVATQAVSLHVANLAPLAMSDPKRFKAVVGYNQLVYRGQVPPNNYVDQSTSVLSFLSKHHITPNTWPYSENDIGVLTSYMGLKWHTTPFPKPSFGSNWTNAQFTSVADDISSKYQEWQNNGFADARNFLFGWDEPSTTAEHVQIPALARVVHQNAPTVKMMVTTTPKTRTRSKRLCTKFGKRRCVKFPGSTYSNENLWNGGADDVDIFTIAVHRFYGRWTSPLERTYKYNNTFQTWKTIMKVRARGKQTWSYSYFMSTKKVPQLVIDAPSTDPQMLMWWNASIGNKGWFLWQFARWAQAKHSSMVPRDPWLSPLSGWSKIGLKDNGEASLVYPPVNVQYGLNDPDGEPVSSLRMETLRDGIEDATLVNRYRARFGATATANLTKQLFGAPKVVSGFTWPVYNNSSAGAKMQALRRTMLTQLES